MTVPIKFILGQEEKTADPLVQVEFPADAPAKAGVYEFQLVVVDNAGVASTPVTLKLVLQGDARAVLRVVNADGKPLDQTVFKLGSTVFLSAAESNSDNGPVQAYLWRLTARP